jgi:hypothetical protein
MWSGRQTPEQLLNYVHRSHADKASEISDIMFSDKGLTKDQIHQEVSIRVKTKEQYDLITTTASGVTSTGLCTQDLHFTPCTYLNDFLNQCSLCGSAGHIHGDQDAIDFLKIDLELQYRRLIVVKSNPKFTSSTAMQMWHTTHFEKTSILKLLIELMQDPEIENGSIIRVLTDKSEIRISDLSTKTVTKRQLQLPSAKEELRKLLEDAKPKEANNYLIGLLKNLGE